MPKRKLSDLETTPQPNSTTKSKQSIQTTRLTQLFDQGVHNLSRALKTARGFERQKLGKREQRAKKEKDEKLLERIGEEIGALKALEYAPTATNYIFKQMLKTKSIAESAGFNEFKQTKNICVSGPRSTAEANVTARMFKSKPVQGVMPGIMGGFRKVLGVDEKGKKGAQSGVKEKTRGDEKEKKRENAKARLDEEGEGETERPSKQREREGEGSDKDESMEEADDDGGDDDDAESEDFSHFDSRLAPDSDEDSDEEEEQPDPEPNRSTSISRSPSPSASQSHSQSPPPKKSKTQTESKKTLTSTTFLPSLSMGGYFSGSESEPEELEPTPGRKNRMGQKARRALWEKKYGAAANHVKKAKKAEKANRDSGWDLRRGATGSGERRGRGIGKGREGGQGRGREDKGEKRKAGGQDDKPMHPSWEAARKAKEQKATAEFKGKKVVFD